MQLHLEHSHFDLHRQQRQHRIGVKATISMRMTYRPLHQCTPPHRAANATHWSLAGGSNDVCLRARLLILQLYTPTRFRRFSHIHQHLLFTNTSYSPPPHIQSPSPNQPPFIITSSFQTTSLHNYKLEIQRSTIDANLQNGRSRAKRQLLQHDPRRATTSLLRIYTFLRRPHQDITTTSQRHQTPTPARRREVPPTTLLLRPT